MLLVLLVLLSAYLLLLAKPGWAAPGQPPLDSLRRRLASPLADTVRVRILCRLTHELRTSDAAQSLTYGLQGLRLARLLQDKLSEVQLLNDLAINYFLREDLTNATRYFQQALVQAEHTPRAGRLLTMALLGLGRIAVQQRDYAEAQRYFQQGRLRMQQHLYPQSPRDLGIADNCLGGLYYNWLYSGEYPDSVKNLALHYNRLSLQYFRRKAAGPTDQAIGLNDLGLVHGLLQQQDSAEFYHRAALRILEHSASPYDLAQTRSWLGAILVAQHRPAEALRLLRRARASARKLRLPALEANCLLQEATALASSGQGASAYRLTRAGQSLLDSIQRREQQADLAQLRVQFDTERERNRVQVLALRNSRQQLQAYRQRQYLWWLASLLLAVAAGLVAAGSLAWRLRRQQRQLIRQHAELTATRAEQDRLYALIAHDLRSPVVAFGGLTTLLTSYVERQDTARLLRLGGRIRQAADSLREMLDNLLHWALAHRGELAPVLEAVPVTELLAKLNQLYQPAAEAAGVQLVVAETFVGCVWADRNMTLTILRNLVSNALQATPAGGRVTVQARLTAPNAVRLEVTDTGVGMSAEELLRVTGGGIPSMPMPGRAGLGLRLSFLFARTQAGHLALTSTSAQGTSAVLTLAGAP